MGGYGCQACGWCGCYLIAYWLVPVPVPVVGRGERLGQDDLHLARDAVQNQRQHEVHRSRVQGMRDAAALASLVSLVASLNVRIWTADHHVRSMAPNLCRWVQSNVLAVFPRAARRVPGGACACACAAGLTILSCFRRRPALPGCALLHAQVCAPILVGIVITTAGPRAGAIFLAAWNCASIFPEYTQTPCATSQAKG